MPTPSRFLLTLVAVAALTAAAYFAPPTPPECPPAPEAVQRQRAGGESEDPGYAALEEVRKDILDRLDRRRQVVRELIEGRLSLAEAADRFRELNVCLGNRWAPCLLYYPGRTEEERVCHQVIQWVRAEEKSQPDAHEEATSVRLEEELATLLRE